MLSQERRVCKGETEIFSDGRSVGHPADRDGAEWPRAPRECQNGQIPRLKRP